MKIVTGNFIFDGTTIPQIKLKKIIAPVPGHL